MSKRSEAGSALVRDVLAHVLRHADPETAQAVALAAWWQSTVPARIARNGWPVRLQRGALIMHTTTSTWASEIELLSSDLLKSLRARVRGAADVTRIRARVGPMPAHRTRGAGQTSPSSPPARPRSELPEEIARELARLSSDGLRDAIAGAAAATLEPVATARAGFQTARARGRNTPQ